MEVFKVNSALSLTNGSEEKVYKVYIFQLDQLVESQLLIISLLT